MTAIDRFDEIPNLVCYFSGADDAANKIDKTGDVINSVTSVYGSDATVLTQTTATSNNITHDGVAKVGECLAFVSPQGTDAGLSGLFAGGTLDETNFTIAVLEQRFALEASHVISTVSGINNPQTAITSTSSRYETRVNGSTREITPEISIDLNPRIAIFRHSGTADEADINIDGSVSTCTGTGSGSVAAVSLMNKYVGDSPMYGKIAIAVFYQARLDDTQVANLLELMQYWRDYGEAPGSGGTTATFGPVTTNDDPSVTGWQWEASTDSGSTWGNAETVMSNVSGETTTTLTVNSAAIEEDQTVVRCRATSTAAPAGVVSHTATLTVVSE